ncbi:F0F1 ATP synthase subunit A [Vermiphilus pyriformis]|nr:MAG: F0F1 ATP synthase subunit A [Vermiphilus pyriformis]
MENLNFLNTHVWKPFARITNSAWLYVNSHTIQDTWVVMGVITLLCLIGRYALSRKGGVLQHIVLQLVEQFRAMVVQTLGTTSRAHTAFITSLFIFIMVCNTITIVPYVEEPTSDINTTIALALISFIYVQAYIIITHGIKGYITDYFKPFFVMFPLNIMGRLSSVISLAFRLFGNIFGGAVISKIYLAAISGSLFFELFGIFTGLNFIIVLFFGLFEGFLQAFVFTMLTLTNLAIGVQGEFE